MNLVCAASYCAGALTCDILNGTESPFESSVIQNRFNHIFKVPRTSKWHEDKTNKIDRLILPQHEKEWLDVTDHFTNMHTEHGNFDGWAFSCHQPCKLIPNLDSFEKVYNVTTTTFQSRWLRFLRHYWLEFNKEKKMQSYNLQGIMQSYMIMCKFDPRWTPIEDNDLIINIEFEDIVSGKWCEEVGGNMDHMREWKRRNYFLWDEYEQDIDVITMWLDQRWEMLDTKGLRVLEDETIQIMNEIFKNGQISA